jgi:DNA-binding MarR family transcriptional regulator
MKPEIPDEPPRPDDQRLIRLLQLLTVESDQFVERFGARHGLHRTDMNALAFVLDAARRDEPLSPSGLAARLGLSPSATTALIDRLEASGHLERHRDPGDRRRVTLSMSEAAMGSGRRLFAPLAEVFTASWSDFTDEERETVARFLSRSIEAMRAVRDDWGNTQSS